MKKYFYLSFLCSSILFISCNNKDIPEVNTEIKKISFTTSINSLSRIPGMNKAPSASITNFDAGDVISVFAVEKTETNASGTLLATNYANNIKYTYSGALFESANPIIYPVNKNSLFFYAVYPYQNSLASTFVYKVRKDQNSANRYTQSDLMTAVTDATTELTPVLKFNHRLSNIIINLTFEQAPTSEVKVSFENVKRSVIANLNTNVYESTGVADSAVWAASNGTNSFKAILPPQTIVNGTNVIKITVGNKQYQLVATADITWKSGIQYEYNTTITKEGEVKFTSEINPWGESTDIETTVPPEILDAMKPYITIYSGNTPPNIENTYFIDPMVTVYCQDEDEGGYEKGKVVSSTYIKFQNQNNTAKTIGYADRSGDQISVGKGAFISGSGNNFTVYLDTEGTSSGIYTRTALVISGTKTSTGIQGIRYAFVMVEKGDDPDAELMDEGVFRVFEDKDGMSLISTWPANINGLQKGPNVSNDNSIFSKMKKN